MRALMRQAEHEQRRGCEQAGREWDGRKRECAPAHDGDVLRVVQDLGAAQVYHLHGHVALRVRLGAAQHHLWQCMPIRR